ncbi:uncharacterized protein [Nicotiana tomentosiformis]|uniref:uncharacterized protein n=1 Tax=Nicotiana tomentosiformis TaxID=4098 RepID=UPI00388C6E5C
MSVREYSLRFDSLARYASSIVATMRDMIHMFIAGLALELTEARATASLQNSMDISRIQVFAQNIERGRHRQQGTERTEQWQRKRLRFARSQEHSQGSYRPQYFGRPPRPPPPLLQGYKYDRYTHSRPDKSSRASGLQRQRGLGQTWSFSSRCDICGRGHLGKCRAGSDACYICGRPGHTMRDCPNRDFGSMAQPAISAIGSSMSVHPLERESQSSAGRDPGSTLSYITLFVMGKFGIVPEILSDPFAISTPIEESIIARQLAACYATVDCRAKKARFHFSGEAVLELVGNTATPRDAEIPTLQSIPVVKEYADVFPDELPGIPPEREINFSNQYPSLRIEWNLPN